MSLAESIRIGKSKTGTQTAVAVGAASGVFLAANPSRIGFYVSAPFANNVTIAFLATAVLGQGVNLPANGQDKLIMGEDIGMSLMQGAINAIASLATTVGVIEIVSTAG